MEHKDKEKYPKFTPDPDSCKLIAEAFKDIKSKTSDITMSLSNLASFVVKSYFEKGMLQKDKKLIEKTFFNRKKYLRRILKEGGDIEKALEKLGKKSSSVSPKKSHKQ